MLSVFHIIQAFLTVQVLFVDREKSCAYVVNGDYIIAEHKHPREIPRLFYALNSLLMERERERARATF